MAVEKNHNSVVNLLLRSPYDIIYYILVMREGNGDDEDLPAYSRHDKIPTWWGNIMMMRRFAIMMIIPSK